MQRSDEWNRTVDEGLVRAHGRAWLPREIRGGVSDATWAAAAAADGKSVREYRHAQTERGMRAQLGLPQLTEEEERREWQNILIDELAAKNRAAEKEARDKVNGDSLDAKVREVLLGGGDSGIRGTGDF